MPPCNCCGPTSCKCKVDNELIEFSFTGAYVWVHTPYPVPLTQCAWNGKFGSYLAPNHVIEFSELLQKDVLTNPGDWSYYTKPGIGARMYGNYFSVLHYDNDSSKPFPDPYQFTNIEFKTDIFEKKCRLLARKVVASSDDPLSGTFPSEEDLPFQVVESMDFKDVHTGNKKVTLNGFGPYPIDLIFRCSSTCDFGENFSADVSGQPSYCNGPIVKNEDPCTSHGSAQGTYVVKHINIPDGADDICFPYNVKSICNKIGGYVSLCPYTQPWDQSWLPGADCAVSFYPLGDFTGENPVFPICSTRLYGVYKDADNEEFEVGVWNSFGGSFQNDPFETDITSLNSVTFKGIWTKYEKDIEYTYDCTSLQMTDSKPYETYSQGTVTVTRQ